MGDNFCSYEGKIALITGAGGAIGAATARLLALRGASIAAVDRPGGSFVGLDSDIPDDRLLKMEADVSQPESVKAYVKATVERFGRIDLFFNAAGISGPFASIRDYPVETFQQVIAVNVLGTFLGLKYVLPVMEAQGGGVVVNAGSLAGLRGSGGLSGYSSSKHAVLGLTKVASSEAAPLGIRVVAIAPGPVEGPMFRGHLANMSPDVDATYERMTAGIPQRRVATPEDVANLVCFLGSDEASHITGGHYSIDGGLCAG